MDELNIQLSQLYGAIVVASEAEKAGLQQLIQDLEELIELGQTRPNDNLEENNSGSNLAGETGILRAADSGDNGILELEPRLKKVDKNDKFAKFQREIEFLENTRSKEAEYPEKNSFCPGEISDQDQKHGDVHKDISKLLSDLEGMKCKAPFEHHWGQIGYHNGIVFNVESISNDSISERENGTSSLESVSVRVVFAQPIAEGMQPCQYFLEGRCRFSEEGCKFSHGELVALSQLKGYSEPNFSAVVPGTRVLAKYYDGLWYPATVSKLTVSGDCEITYDSYNEKATVPLHDTFPLDKDQNGDEEVLLLSSDSSNSEDDVESDLEEIKQSEIVWKHMTPTSALGQWEKHTKGIGSKLMQKMGYVPGTGLGKEGEGRVYPIDAVVLPPGRSLDKCMELKEKAGGASVSLFSVEKRLKLIQKKEKLRAEQLRQKTLKSESVFNFLNSHLNLKDSTDIKKSNVAEKLNKESTLNLNKKLLNIGEHVNQITKEIAKCKEGMKRHDGRDQSTVEIMKSKLNFLETKLTELQRREVTVTCEQKHRSDRKKLVIF